ncbi:DUF4291 domain-containing protein [Micromonospora psammae]|uniref:DUF4291 domain-containing protein n=1 Tax=Micromonospora sp. CPCC 205556 TaxID=3122398 RepID=UPI002FEF60AC
MSVPPRQVRAHYTAGTVTVYQAYPPEIAEAALAAGRFVPPFRRGRMTWIKPSFRWMMYRSGWATKPGQERVLAVEMTRPGLEWALGRACLSGYEPRWHTDRADWARRLRGSDVRVQWDPERSLRLAPLPYRSLQLGLSGAAADRYVDEWLVGLTDVTARAREIRALLDAGDDDGAAAALPPERPYPLSPALAAAVGADTD